MSSLQQNQQGSFPGSQGRGELRIAGRQAAGHSSEVSSLVIKGRPETRTKLPATV